MKQPKSVKSVKAWAVVDGRGRFELGVYTGRYTVHPDKKWCEAWSEHTSRRSKWRVIPVLITPIPKKPKG